MQWVFDNSPYTGNALVAHLKIGDIANSQNDYLIWMDPKELAEITRCSVSTFKRITGEMVKDGYLEVVQQGGGRKNWTVFRFLMPDKATQNDDVYEDGNCPKATHETRPSETETTPNAKASLLISNSRNTTQLKGVAKAPSGYVSEEVETLCTLLAQVVGKHMGNEPKINKTWREDMDLMLRLGAKNWATAKPVAASDIRDWMAVVFTCLNKPTGSGSFCWADQVRSPGAIRKHWDQVINAGKRHFSIVCQGPLGNLGDDSEVMRGILYD